MLHLPDTKLLITTFIRFNFCHVYESTSKRYFYKKKISDECLVYKLTYRMLYMY